MSSNISESVRQAILGENYRYEKVIIDVADGFKRSGFFTKAEWKDVLINSFERKRLGLTPEEIQLHTTVVSNNSFLNGLTGQSTSTPIAAGPAGPAGRTGRKKTQIAQCTSTPIAAGRTGQKETQIAQATYTPIAAVRTGQKETQMSCKKRRPFRDDRKLGPQTKSKEAASLLDEVEAANILVDLKRADWGQILPSVNEKQNAVRVQNVFEKSKQLKGIRTSARNQPSDIGYTAQTVTLRDENQMTTNNSITKRRDDYRPSAKLPTAPLTATDVQQQAIVVTEPSTKRRHASYRPTATLQTEPLPGSDVQQGAVAIAEPVPKRSKRGRSEHPKVVATIDQANKDILTNITNRRMTRKHSQLLAAFTGSGPRLTLSNIAERRSTAFYQRTHVLFTMVDATEFKDILQTYNIFVADDNEKYDYVITERICRSPKFLSAVVSGKPILSVKWLHALNEQKIWLDPLTYLLKDDKGEKDHNFDLSATLLKATNKRLFEKCSILVTPHTSISPDSLKGVIFSGGGKFLKTTLVPRRGDEVICISDKVDKRMWPTLQQKYPTLKKIISLDGFAKMIFQFTHDVSSADILHQI